MLKSEIQELLSSLKTEVLMKELVEVIREGGTDFHGRYFSALKDGIQWWVFLFSGGLEPCGKASKSKLNR